MSEHNAVVGVYHAHTDAEAAVKALQKSGFDMQKLSSVGKDSQTEEHVVGYYNAGDRMQFGAHGGPCGAGCGACCSGRLSFLSRGIGPVIVFGPLVGGLVGALEGAVVVGGLTARPTRSPRPSVSSRRPARHTSRPIKGYWHLNVQ